MTLIIGEIIIFFLFCLYSLWYLLNRSLLSRCHCRTFSIISNLFFVLYCNFDWSCVCPGTLLFKLGSYKQITNNLKYYDNPDNGTCIRADFCGALYKNKKDTNTNITLPLPPVKQGLRVGYFITEPYT